MIAASALRKRTAAVMVSFGVKGYSVRVGRAATGAWAHCDQTRKEIVLGRELRDCDWVFVNQIILHEVAHAIAGGAGHSREWLKTARAMGYRLGVQVPYNSPIEGEHKWVAVCATGAHSAIRYEKTSEDGESICGMCQDTGGGDVLVFWERL